MGKKMISEQIVTRNGQKGFVGPDGKWYPIAGQGPAIPNFGERLPGESTKDFHNRLRGNLPPAEPAKPEKPAEPQKPKPVEPEPQKPEPQKPAPAKLSLSQQYQAARDAKDYAKADQLGKEIWARRYSGKFTVPSVEKSGPRVNVATTQQQRMFDALKADKPDPTVFKRAQRIGKPMEAYDVVLDYLLSEGHAETVEEAHYVMMQLDSEYIQEVIQERAWWDPAGLFTKNAVEKALEKPVQGYNPNTGTTKLGNDVRGYTDQILAPRGGIPGSMEKGKPETWRRLSSDAARQLMPRYRVVRGATQLTQDAKDNKAVSASMAQLARDEAEARARAQKLADENAARETQAAPPIVVKPKPAPVVAAKPAAPVAAKRPSILSDVDDLKRMRAASLMRQQGRKLPGGKIPVGSDLKPVTESGYFPTPESQRADEAKYKLSRDRLPGEHKPVKGKPPTKK